MAKQKSPKRAKVTNAPAKSASVEPTPMDLNAARVLASPVAAMVELANIFMVQSRSSRVPAAYSDANDINVSMVGDAAEVIHNDDLSQFYVRIQFTLKAARKDADISDEPLVEIMGAFMLFYKLPETEGITEENLVAFAKTSGVFSVWPYWREFVQSTSLRLSLPPIVLPTYHI